MQDDSDLTAGAGTGDPRVDELVARLGQLGDLPLEDHVAVYEDLHDGLGQVLSELDPGR